jgi:hypothetical protein
MKIARMRGPEVVRVAVKSRSTNPVQVLCTRMIVQRHQLTAKRIPTSCSVAPLVPAVSGGHSWCTACAPVLPCSCWSPSAPLLRGVFFLWLIQCIKNKVRSRAWSLSPRERSVCVCGVGGNGCVPVRECMFLAMSVCLCICVDTTGFAYCAQQSCADDDILRRELFHEDIASAPGWSRRHAVGINR